MSESKKRKHHKACDVLDDLSLALEHADRLRGFASGLSWSHYRTLTKVENKAERLSLDDLAEHLRNEALEGLDENNVHHFHHAMRLWKGYRLFIP
jgi:hypothetical protein